MRVLLQGRELSPTRRGGDSTVVDELARELRALGHGVVTAAAPPESGTAGFDVVHAQGLNRSVLNQTEAFVAAAKASETRLVVTPVWWPLRQSVQGLGPREWVRYMVKGLPLLRVGRDRQLRSIRGVRRRQRAVLEAASVVCPSGPTEGFALRDEFGPLPIEPVHLGTRVTRGPSNRPAIDVLCVAARIDPHKNQLNLIRAVRDMGLRLRVIGSEDLYPSYARRCHDAAGPDVEFLGHQPPRTLVDEYRSARVHALPSFFEVPGLTCIDAAAAGAAVVGPCTGTLADYLGRDAWYASTDAASIRRAVTDAFEAGAPDDLAQRLVSKYTWTRTAQRYAELYES